MVNKETINKGNRKLAIGVDVGGKRTKLGLVDLGSGEVLDVVITSTETKNKSAFLNSIVNAVKQFKISATAENNHVAGIGFGVPAFVFNRRVVDSTYGFIDFMEDYPLADLVEKACGLHCRLDNDARVVALGEALYGESKNENRVLVLTLGTGLGIGFAINGELDGAMPLNHMAGHMTINDNNVDCYCGKRGCLEAQVSATGIIQAAKALGWNKKYPSKTLDVQTVFLERESGNPDAIAVIENLITALQIGIGNYINIYAPDTIVIGGGVSKSLKNDLHHFQHPSHLKPYKSYKYKVVVSALQEHAGILGSASLFADVSQ
ncbi:MAG: ROK family protein [Chitinophagaceae bacterium]